MKYLILTALLLSTVNAKPALKLSKEAQLIEDVLVLRKGAAGVIIQIYDKLDRFRIKVVFQWIGEKKHAPTDKSLKKMLKQARKDGFNVTEYRYVGGTLSISITKDPVKKEINLD